MPVKMDVMNHKPAKTALVTAGAKRIGAAIVEGLAERGFDIAIHHFGSQNEALRLRDHVEKIGRRCSVFQADLTQADQTINLFESAVEKLGPISLLVNNASIFEPDSVTDTNLHLWDDHFDIHLKASVKLIELLHGQSLEHMLAVNMIDQRVLHPGPTYFSYTLSKSALWTATKTVALALAPKTRVNAIGPGPTLPNVRQNAEDFAKQVRELPLRTAPQLDEFAATIDYLWQAKSVTGQMICLDGGQHLGAQNDMELINSSDESQ